MFPEALNLELSDVLAVLALAASPIAELRVAIPVAITGFHFPWYHAFLVAIIGNLLPVPFILLFLDTATRLLSKVAFLERILNWLF